MLEVMSPDINRINTYTIEEISTTNVLTCPKSDRVYSFSCSDHFISLSIEYRVPMVLGKLWNHQVLDLNQRRRLPLQF